MSDNKTYSIHIPCKFCFECLDYDSCTDKGSLKWCDRTIDCLELCGNTPCRYFTDKVVKNNA